MTEPLPRVVQKGLEFRKRLAAGENMAGAWSTLGAPDIAYLMARAGLDYILIDLEHGSGGIDTVKAQAQALLSLDCAVMVRLPDHHPGSIKRVLDAGANIILAPGVDTPKQARAILDAALFPEAGSRGVAVGAIFASDFGYSPISYFHRANDALTCIFQIESPRAIANLDELIGIDRIDGFFVGPNDLSAALGLFRQYDDPEFTKAVADVERKVLSAGKIMGCLPYPGNSNADLAGRGVQLAPSGSDQTFVRDGAARLAGSRY